MIVLTRGNGSQHAVVVEGREGFLDLETLATAPAHAHTSARSLNAGILLMLAVLWVALLVSASAIQSNTWFLLAVGGMGILQNVVVAARRKTPDSAGLPLEFVGVFAHVKVMKALVDVEEHHAWLGESMRDTFFPGRLWPDEVKKWRELEKIAVENDEAIAKQKAVEKQEAVEKRKAIAKQEAIAKQGAVAKEKAASNQKKNKAQPAQPAPPTTPAARIENVTQDEIRKSVIPPPRAKKEQSQPAGRILTREV